MSFDDDYHLPSGNFQVIKSLLETSRRNSWADIVHCKLVSMLTNVLYKFPSEPADSSSPSTFLVDKVDLIGGIEFIFLEVCCFHISRHFSYCNLFGKKYHICRHLFCKPYELCPNEFVLYNFIYCILQ